MNEHTQDLEILNMTSDIICSYISGNKVDAAELPKLINSVYKALQNPEISGGTGKSQQEAAVPVNKSITNDYLICLEDGKKLKMLRRYLRSHYNMSPDDYREKWGLPKDYPMVAPSYSEKRSSLAKDIGLGSKKLKKRNK